jgi:CRP-like cAMP-binding protein
MHQKLIAYINEHASWPLTNEEVLLIETAFQPKKLRKRQYLLQEGEICKYLAFIVKGAVRQYSIDDKGTEHIINFGIENWWIGDRESYTMLTPSAYNIDALEETDLLIITRAEILNLQNKLPAMIEMLRLMDEKNAIANQRRLSSNISNTAEKRYAEFEKCYPEFNQRFPQHLIASYLGITKSSLSRIRGNVLKGK